MIRIADFANSNWSYITRILGLNFQSLDHQFRLSISIAEQSLTNSKTSSEKLKIEELVKFIDDKLEQINIAKDEVEIMRHYAKYLLILDAEQGRIMIHIKYINMENMWLESEIEDLQAWLTKIEYLFLAAESETMFYRYFYNMRNYGMDNRQTQLEKRPSLLHILSDNDSELIEDVPKTLQALYRVVKQFITEGRHSVAILWCLKNVEDFRKRYGEVSFEISSIYTLLSLIYKDLSYFKISQDYLEKSLVINEKVHGKNSDQVGITLSLLGTILGNQKMYDKALGFCKKALEIRENVLGKTHLDIARLYGKLAEFSLNLNLWNDTIKYYKICMPILDYAYDSTDIYLIKSYSNLAKAYIETNHMSKASDCLEKVNVSYAKKNNPGLSNVISPFEMIQDCLGRNVSDFRSELLMQKFGTISEISDENVIEIMVLFYQKIGEPKVAESLKGWIDISNRFLNQLEVTKTDLQAQAIAIASTNQRFYSGSSTHSTASQDIRNMFKRKK